MRYTKIEFVLPTNPVWASLCPTLLHRRSWTESMDIGGRMGASSAPGGNSIAGPTEGEWLRLLDGTGEFGTWTFDPAGRAFNWSTRAAELLGLPRPETDESLSGWLTRVHPADRERVAEAFGQALRGPGTSWDLEYRTLGDAADGEASPRLRTSFRVLRDAATGRPLRVLGLLRELPAGDRTAETARREADLRTLYNRAPAPMHSVGPDGLLLQVNDEWVRFLGYPREEAIGHSFAEFMNEESRRRYLDVERPRLLRTRDGVREAEYRLRRRAGDWVEVLLRARPERDAEGRFLRSLAVLVDVTARNRAEAQLRQAQKIEALGQLTSGVAHDFNNMLQVVSSALRLLKRHLPRGPEGERPRRLHAAAQEGAARGAKLTQQLLAFARRGRLEPEAVEVNGRIRAFAEGLLSRALGDGVTLRLELGEETWPALVDPTQLEVALLNLAVNARDAVQAAERPGTLAIETANIRLAPGDHLVGAGPMAGEPDGTADIADAGGGSLPPGDYVLVAVTDDGVGMDAQTLARATEPFFTTKGLGKGTGLGLSQVYGFARQSGGALRVQSHPGAGTAVHLYIPRAPEGALRQPAAAVDDAAGEGDPE
jgi:PAS domain S-box-containing protein